MATRNHLDSTNTNVTFVYHCDHYLPMIKDSVATSLQWVSLFLILICLSGMIAQWVADSRYTGAVYFFGFPGVTLGLIGFMYASWGIKRSRKCGGFCGIYYVPQTTEQKCEICNCAIYKNLESRDIYVEELTPNHLG